MFVQFTYSPLLSTTTNDPMIHRIQANFSRMLKGHNDINNKHVLINIDIYFVATQEE